MGLYLWQGGTRGWRSVQCCTPLWAGWKPGAPKTNTFITQSMMIMIMIMIMTERGMAFFPAFITDDDDDWWKHPTRSDPSKGALLLLWLWPAKGCHQFLLEKSAWAAFCLELTQLIQLRWYIHLRSKGSDSRREGCPRCRCAPADAMSRHSLEVKAKEASAHRQDEDGANVDQAEDHPVRPRKLVQVVCARWSCIISNIRNGMYVKRVGYEGDGRKLWSA